MVQEWCRTLVRNCSAMYKALKCMERAVEIDTLGAVDNTVDNKYSSSAVDTLTTFYQIQVFWTLLA